jgi:phytoene synthase
VELGLALQLTNILRDIAADAAQGRLYLPLEDLARFGVAEADLLRFVAESEGEPPAGLGDLLRFEADRARAHYAAAAQRLPASERRSMLAAEIMGAIYRAVLEEWARRGHPVGRARVKLSPARKIGLALRTSLRVYWDS